MINDLLDDWSSFPTLTTLVSVAVPASEVQFPTVTVCPDDSPPDNWAMVHKLAKFYDYKCTNEEKCQNNMLPLRYKKYDFKFKAHPSKNCMY